MLSFADLFKSNALSQDVTLFTPVDTILFLAIAFALGLFIYFIYKLTYTGVMFSRSFGISLVVLSMISTFIILAVTSNVVLSLGMVGALSIVRFRSAIKDPLDIVYLFWSLSVGIVLGARQYFLAILGSLIIGGILVLLAKMGRTGQDYIIILEFSDGNMEQKAADVVKAYGKRVSVKTKTVTDTAMEVTYAVSLAGEEAKLVNELKAIRGVEKAVLVSYNGDYME
ncbi:MAG: DUF4956 domain-containing protein [Ruminococcaceae bacterium]|nr:DUF4956 domain-containing protein [Oscillospiraceae bacterium]